MQKHLLLAYSWSFSNIGDIGITPGIINLIRKQKPQLPIRILASQSENHMHFGDVKQYYHDHYPDCDVYANPFSNLISQSAAWKRFIERWGPQKFDSFEKGCLPSAEAAAMAADLADRVPKEMFEDLRERYPVAAQAFANAGFVLYNSGTTLNFGRLGGKNVVATLRYAMPLLFARALGIPYGVNSQSYDAIDYPIDLVYRRLFTDARFVYCRDTDSLNYLHQRGLVHQHSGFRPDSTFFFQIFDDAWADRFLAEHGLKNKEFISIIVRIADTRKNDSTIGGSVTAERTLAQMEKIKNFIEQWVAATGMKVLLCHETRLTLEIAKQYLWDIIPEKTRQNCVYLDEFWLPEQAYSIIKRTRILVSQEMHSIIMSINVGTPVIHNPFAEAGRKRQMLRDIGVGDWLVDIDECTAEEMMGTAMKIHNDYSFAERRIQELLPGLEARANETLSEIWTQWKKD
jgi:polysaccharide pyruvyl transferase WcaK-like protein